MSKKDCQFWIKRIDAWLEASWMSEDGNVPIDAELSEHARTCSSCAARLHEARLLSGNVPLSPHMPEDSPNRISMRVMDQIREHDSLAYHSSNKGRGIKEGLAIAAGLILVFTIALTFITRQDGIAGPEPDYTAVVLDLRLPDAQQVSVVGDWNNWDPEAQTLKKTDDGERWEIQMRLEQGREYRYQFVIDGETWMPDPESPIKVDDGFGGTNSVLVI